MYLWISVALFAVFILNVLLGSLDIDPFLGVIPEMLTLMAATVFFVLEILRREAADKNSRD